MAKDAGSGSVVVVVPECIIDCGTVVVDSGTVVVARGVGGTVVVPTLRGYRVVGTPLVDVVVVGATVEVVDDAALV